MRYQRQSILPEIGISGQAALARAKVLVVGAGGLGSPALQYLVAAGVGLHAAGGTIGIIDDDVVDLSNLQRQILFTESDIGKNKAHCAAKHLTQRNSDCHIKVFETRLTRENILPIFADFDVVIDGSDNFASKYLINDAAVKLKRPVVYGAILGLEGQASVFWAEHGPCYRCLYPTTPISHVPNCAEAGTLGGIAGVMGSMLATEAMKLALGLSHCQTQGLEPLIGQLLLMDAHTWQSRQVNISQQAHCPVCSLSPEEIQLPESQEVSCQTTQPKNLSLNDLQGLFESGIPFSLLDVREPAEWASGRLEGALHIPLGQLLHAPDALATLSTDAPILVYCQHGIRSQQAARYLKEQGFDAFNLIVDWSQLNVSTSA